MGEEEEFRKSVERERDKNTWVRVEGMTTPQSMAARVPRKHLEPQPVWP